MQAVHESFADAEDLMQALHGPLGLVNAFLSSLPTLQWLQPAVP